MKKLGIMIAIAMIAATAVRAETLALWDLDGLAANSSSATAKTNHINMSCSLLAAGMPSKLDTSIGWPDTIGTKAESWRLSSGLTYAISTNNYFGFTLTPDSGHMVSYSNLFVRFAVNNPNDNTDVTFYLLSDRTGFENTAAAVLGTFNVTNATYLSDGTSTRFTKDFDLSAIAELQNAQGAIEFRVYVTSVNGSRMAIGHDSFINGTDDLRVDGTIQYGYALAQWDLTGTAANSTSAPVTTVHSDISSTALAASPVALASARIDPAVVWADAVGTKAENWRLGSSLQFALDEELYYSFTLTPDEGREATFNNISARLAVNNNGTNATSDVTFYLLSNQTGFTTNGVLSSFNATTDNTNNVPTIFTYEFDLRESGLSNLTTATEFRIYFSSVSGNRMGIGHPWNTADPDDLVVRGYLTGSLPASIVDWEFVSGGSVMKLVIDAPADPALYYPKGTTDLTIGFSPVEHAATDAGPFDTITNLTVSTTEDGNKVIFVEATEGQKFFGIGEE